MRASFEHGFAAITVCMGGKLTRNIGVARKRP
jgi:hypothetical protein